MSSTLDIDCIGIAYDWMVAPIDISDHDVALVMASSRCSLSSSLSSEELQTMWKNSTAEHFCYHAKLPGEEPTVSLSDVAGTIGLLWSASNITSANKAASFERLVSDAIMWCLESEEYVASGRQTVILVQGPMLPKFRGRCLYRAFDQCVSMYALTYQPEWQKRIEGGQGRFDIFNRRDEVGVILGPVHPLSGIDHSTRDWICRSESHVPYHFELITNTWNCCDNSAWLQAREEEIRFLIKTTVLDEVDISIPLPGPLACATKQVRRSLEWENNYLHVLRLYRTAQDSKLDGRMIKVLRAIDKELFPASSKDLAGELKLDAATSDKFRDLRRKYTVP